MKTRFTVDLLRPRDGAAAWHDWFIGERGLPHLGYAGGAAAVVLLLVAVGLILPTYWRLSGNLEAIPQLERELASTDADLSTLNANLEALSQEARRQIRWSDLLSTFGEQIPAQVKLQRVEVVTARPQSQAPGAAAAPPPGSPQAPAETTLKVESLTPLREGSAGLTEVARFMAGLMRDEIVRKRFQLKSWEIKPAPATGTEPGLLNVTVTLGERAQ